MAALIVVAVLVLFALFVAAQTIRIIPQARAGVVERLGRYSRTLTPGLTIVVPFIDRVRPLIDLREQVVTLPAAAGDHRGQRRRSGSTPSCTSRSPTPSRRHLRGRQPAAGDRAAHGHDAAQHHRRADARGDADAPRPDQHPAARRARRGDGQVGDPHQPRRAQVGRPAARRSRRRWRSRCAPSATAARRSSPPRASSSRRSSRPRARSRPRCSRPRARRRRRSCAPRARRKAIDTVFTAIHEGDPDQGLLSYQYLQMLPQLAQGEANKIFVIPQRVHAGARQRRRRDRPARRTAAASGRRLMISRASSRPTPTALTTAWAEQLPALEAERARELPYAAMLTGPVVGRLLRDARLRWSSRSSSSRSAPTRARARSRWPAALPPGGRIVTASSPTSTPTSPRRHIDAVAATPTASRSGAARRWSRLAALDEPVDLCFIDADKERLRRLLRGRRCPSSPPHGLIVADNTLRGGRCSRRDGGRGDGVMRRASTSHVAADSARRRTVAARAVPRRRRRSSAAAGRDAA